jgi:hypothetical protein
MRKARWLAAVLAVGVLIPYCEQLHRVVATGTATSGSEVSATATKGASTRAPAVARTTTTTTTTTPTSPSTSTSAFTFTTTATSTLSGELPGVMSDEWASGKFAEFSRAQAEEMVGRCELRWQMPRVADEKYVASVRALYVELTGEDGKSLREMTDAIRIGSDDDPIAVHRRLAEKRAGRGGEVGGSIYERYLQLQLDESERAQREGVELGAKYTVTGCDAERALFRSTR